MRLLVMRVHPDLSPRIMSGFLSQTLSSVFATRSWQVLWQSKPFLRRQKLSEKLRSTNRLRKLQKLRSLSRAECRPITRINFLKENRPDTNQSFTTKEVKTSPLRSTINAGTSATHQAVDPEKDLPDADAGTRALILPRAGNHVGFNAGNSVIFEFIASSYRFLLRLQQDRCIA